MSALLQQYDALVAQGALRADDVQRSLAVKFDALAQQLEQATHRTFFTTFFRAPIDVQGFYIWGGVGRGKTMLMDMFVASVDVPKKRRTHFHSFMQDVHARIFKERQQNPEADVLISVADQIAKDAQLLCFDEMAITDVADAMILARLFTRLFQKHVVVVATSNMPPDHLYNNGLNRPLFEPFVQLLKQKCEVMQLDGAQDYRLEKLQHSGVWFDGADSARQLNEAYLSLTAQQASKSMDVALNGRKLHVPRTSGGAAFFTFDELCEQPLGAEDYLELARHFHTIFIEGIPRFTLERRNGLRRFIILIDILYDAGVNLVASAAAAPQDLVVDMDGYENFGFSRTCSRLIEMRSDEYLKRIHHGAGRLEHPESS